jgi:chromosome partitioning protein
MVADLVVIPSGPCAPDIWALAESIDAARMAQELRPQLLARLVLNRADRTATARAAHDALRQAGLPALETTLGSRIAFGEALAAGQGVTAYAPASIAALETRRLAEEIETLLAQEKERSDAA